MAEVVRPYRGVSAESRLRQRRSQLLEACLDVVGESGVSGTTVDLVCRQARLSKRYFYESFADREAVLVAALGEVLDRIRAALVAVIAEDPKDPDEQMRRLVGATVETIAADRRVARLWVDANHLPALDKHRSDAYGDFAQLLLDILIPDTAAPGAHSAFVLVVAGTTEVLRHWLAEEHDRPSTEIVDVLARVGQAIRVEFAPAR